jgi:selenide,water dikinase
MHRQAGPTVTSVRIRVVLAGAGHAHLLALRDLADRERSGIELTVVTPDRDSLYSGMIPGVLAGHFSRDDLAIPVAPLAAACGATLVTDEVTGLDPASKTLTLRSGAEIGYDILSLDVGSVSSFASVPGACENAVPVRPLAGMLEAVDTLERRRLGPSERPVAVVGAGAAGCEIVLALDRRLNGDAPPGTGVPLLLVSGTSGILDGFPPAVARHFAHAMGERGIGLRTGVRGAAVEGGALVLADGDRIPVAATLWAGDAAPHPWLARSGLPVDPTGFVLVDRHLRAGGRTDILVSGDAASFSPRPLPKAGVHAVRQGEILADSLLALARGRTPPAYRPQRDALYILTTGGRHAVATRNGFTIAGRWVWQWKRWIDNRFVRNLRTAAQE